ncbi:hypothetical protein OV203_47260 [Nannocystis sp. ILAH1]|uniref:hypothetical protein n=1 Tax=unclassified Nannocystis TaxID=2627009 RepID=UPI0022701AB3|nr:MULTISPECIES: hypothetical protein [unclassified Nannocystis]MCY0994817.1 hypothetical protein [Nannocystis sp. ILAH1]MCY1065355.1 hypothetical protein [Nannocystis sp. RBIL2]
MLDSNSPSSVYKPKKPSWSQVPTPPVLLPRCASLDLHPVERVDLLAQGVIRPLHVLQRRRGRLAPVRGADRFASQPRQRGLVDGWRRRLRPRPPGQGLPRECHGSLDRWRLKDTIAGRLAA